MVEAAVAKYGYVVLFVGSAIEGDAFLIAATFLAQRGYLDLTMTIVVAALGTSTANHFYYWLARSHGREMLASLSGSPRLSRIAGAVTRHSRWLLFVSRFVYGLRIAIPAACGATGMRPLAFSAADLAGSALWSITVGLAGLAIGHAFELVLEDLRRYEWPIAAGLLLIVAIVLAFRGRDWKTGAIVERQLEHTLRNEHEDGDPDLHDDRLG